MTDNSKVKSQEERQKGLAPETHNDEQDDHRNQAQEVSEQAQEVSAHASSPTESTKPADNTPLDNSKQDTVDHMRDMESSGRVDMDAYAGEPNHDDNVDKYGKGHKPDGLRGDGT
ncbi:hypothetical protein SAMN06297468_1505 [Altererythrobacter xiamenensis]|uniref:Uncharacterized protein n=1 Tax=Altererythrobacter xiamenensis TaxID=1316679 RepID=A0A1Y6F328_9SPHN|nr:hypothetical protein [Altererythrobacter xiamenensis]SMQ69298.1 hypothetical protein SAMN06297468_1505 [Altererythrobacter xiamenensis]